MYVFGSPTEQLPAGIPNFLTSGGWGTGSPSFTESFHNYLSGADEFYYMNYESFDDDSAWEQNLGYYAWKSKVTPELVDVVPTVTGEKIHVYRFAAPLYPAPAE